MFKSKKTTVEKSKNSIKSSSQKTSNEKSKSKSKSKFKSNNNSSSSNFDKSKKSSDEKSKTSNKSSQTCTFFFFCMKPPTPKIITKSHKSHPQHPLEKDDSQKSKYKCDGCKLHGVGERYVCKPCNYKYNLHVDCISASSTTKFEGYKCKLLLKPLKCRTINCKHGEYHRSCDACAMTIEGFVYHCEDNDMDFHPSCTKLKKEIRIEDVIFRLQKEASSKCLCCQRKKLKGTTKNIRGWTYVSNHNNYTFHVHCLMEMAMKFPTSKVNGASSSSSSTLAFQNLNIPKDSIKTIVNGSSSTVSISMKMLEIFLKVVLPLLMGADPATLILSLAAVGIKELAHLLLGVIISSEE